MYSTGPGRRPSNYDVAKDATLASRDYVYPSTVYTETASHGGEDVALFATGPYSQLFHGLMDQHEIPHVLSFVSCFGDGITI